MSAAEYSNHLRDETSPYLHQHAHNPVEWHPWGEEALARARSQDRPILLSVGYSACHWCHVMARESFENEAIAQIMNAHFVNIKVDREERPDLDEIYMAAVQAMSGSGGWPLTVFLTPDLRPFYGGTYFPPTGGYGRPGFPKVLRAVAEFYRTQREQVETQAARLTEMLRRSAEFSPGPQEMGEGLLEAACAQLRRSFDPRYGGFGGAPKFPGSMNLALLLRHYRSSDDRGALEMVELTLKKMAAGGLYDQLGGGFHRYSVDERWLVPHFEKMLYDNALLAWIYLEAYQVTGASLYRRVVEETLDYVRREMTSVDGGFCAAQDADSEGEEGRYFVWEVGEVEALLGAERARLFGRYYHLSPEGNFEGGNILHTGAEMPALASALGVEEAELRRAVEEGRRLLLAARQRRVAPGRDDKVIVAWNGLMISAMARAYQVLGKKAYLRAGSAAADFVLSRMRAGGSLLHTWSAGRARLPAYQDDYAALIHGLLDLYEAGFEERWLEEARAWTGVMLEKFWDERRGGFFYAEEGAADLIVRSRNPYDNPTPSGNALGVLVLLRLAALGGEPAYRRKAEQTLRLFAGLMEQMPAACPQMLCALDFYRQGPQAIAVIGRARERAALLRPVHRRFLPNKGGAGGAPPAAGGQPEPAVALLEGKMEAPDGGARAYVCRNFVCSPPVDSGEEVLELLETGPQAR